MGDVYAALSVMLLAGILAAWIGARIAVRTPAVVSALLATAAVAVLIVYAAWLIDSVQLARILPVRNVAVWGNVQPIAAGLLAGIAWRRLPGARWQRVLLVTALAAIGIWRTCAVLIGDEPKLGADRWVKEVCRQSTTSTCSAAAAATLLHSCGIESSEGEMARLCITHVEGTSMLGLYRGLKIKTEGTGWNVRVIKGDTDALARSLPAVVSIEVQGLRKNWLGIGARHSIAVLRREEDGRFVVGDPFSGRQLWTANQLAEAWTGEGFGLVKRE